MNTPEIQRYISKKNQEVARKRWKNATPEERSEVGKMLAKARAKKRKESPGKCPDCSKESWESVKSGREFDIRKCRGCGCVVARPKEPLVIVDNHP